MILQDRSGVEGGEQNAYSAPRWRSPPQASHGWPGQCRKWMQKALAGMNKDEKTNLTWPMKQSDFPSRSQRIWSLKLKQSKKMQNANHLIENVSAEQRSAFITIKWAARLLIPTDSYKAWNQNSVSQQNSLGTRTKIVKQQAFKTCHLLQRSVEPKTANETIKWFHLQTCGNQWEKRFMPCMPLFMQHRPCMATSKKTANGYICRISRI